MKETTRQLVLAALLLAGGLLLPLVFHLALQAGAVFLPMHYPVLVGGFFLAPPLAFGVGLLAPFLSGVLTGMPAFPLAWVLMAEMSGYGLTAALLRRHTRMGVLGVLLVSMGAGRAVRFLASWILLPLLGLRFSPAAVAGAVFVTAFPGILLQLVLLPPLLRRLLAREGAAG